MNEFHFTSGSSRVLPGPSCGGRNVLLHRQADARAPGARVCIVAHDRNKDASCRMGGGVGGGTALPPKAPEPVGGVGSVFTYQVSPGRHCSHQRPYKPKSNRATGSLLRRCETRALHLTSLRIGFRMPVTVRDGLRQSSRRGGPVVGPEALRRYTEHRFRTGQHIGGN
jgi:hypothetical protein